MGVRVKLVERSDVVVDGVDASPAFLVPPLVASPDFLLHFIVRSLDVLLKDKRLTEIQQLGLPARCLRVACDEFVLVYKGKTKDFC